MQNLHPTEKKVLSTIHEHRMVNDGDTVAVATSGGPDSVCLLRILYLFRGQLNINLIVAHLEHGLRPQEDKQETEFVYNLAKELNLPLAYYKANNIKHGPSMEERAREVRYRFLEKVSDDYDVKKVALGHNMNDQAETVLINLLRGSGPTGLSGMPPIREKLFIRPLINITRDEIQDYLKEKGIPFMTDSSNLDKRYVRNKIRLELIPILIRYQPRIIEHLSRLASILRQEDEFMKKEAAHRLKSLVPDSSDHVLDISLPDLKKLSTSIQSRIIRQIIKQTKGDLRKISTAHVKAIMDLGNNSKPQAKINLPDNLTVKRVYNRLRFSLGIEIETPNFYHETENMGVFHIPEINRTIKLEEIPKKDFSLSSLSPFEAFLDLDMIQWPLRIRNFRAGDRFIPFGSRHFKKLKEIFIDNKIPSEKRKKIIILETDNNIVWVCGIRIDNRYRIKGGTKRILRCKIE